MVLETLSQKLLSPRQISPISFCLSRTALLLALGSAKRVSELHAHSIHPLCTKFLSVEAGVFLRPNPAFMPKCSPAFTCEVMKLSVFHLPPFSSEEDQRLNASFPVHAFRAYIDMTSPFRKSYPLFTYCALYGRCAYATHEGLLLCDVFCTTFPGDRRLVVWLLFFSKVNRIFESLNMLQNS